MTYSALIERLEKEGGSRELDAEIMRSLNQLPAGEYLSHYEPIPWEQQQAMVRNRAPRVEAANPVFKLAPHPYTTSLDAAIALCERSGWEVVMMHRPLKEWGIVLQADDCKPFLLEDWESSQFLPNALCIALLRALSTEDGK